MLKMKLTEQQMDEIIDAVVDQLDHDVDVNGYRDYDIYSFVPKSSKEEVKRMIEETLNKNSNLQELFDLQIRFQELAGFSIRTTQFIRLAFIGIVTEACEALEETNWKPWKQPQDKDENKFKEEIVDIWHFLINLTLASGMDADELMVRFKSKNKVNVARQEKKY